jgi:hypothetical protein
MMSAITRPWFGPLSLASPELVTRLHAVPSFAALVARGGEASGTLVYVPPKREDDGADVFVVGRMFAWDEHSPVVWIFSTIGLCLLDQPALADRKGFHHFELVIGTNNSSKEDPFPARIGMVLSQPPATFPAWDWAQVSHPPLLQWLAIAGQEVARLIRDHSSFAIGDTLTLGPGGESWTRSVLTHSMILPVPPHMLALGLAPFNRAGDPTDTVKPGEWATNPGSDRFAYGFYWLLPVSEKEHEKANREGSWNVFADLVDLAPKQANDDCAVAFDLLRGNH